jgi:hypothetical protein
VQVQGLSWVGVRTDHTTDQARFIEDTLGLRVTHHEKGFWVFNLPDGGRIELFDQDTAGKEHFSAEPVVELLVVDLSAAVDELTSAGVELQASPVRPGSIFAGRTATGTSFYPGPAGKGSDHSRVRTWSRNGRALRRAGLVPMTTVASSSSDLVSRGISPLRATVSTV